MKSILGIVRYFAFIPDFIQDADSRIGALNVGLHRLSATGGRERKDLLAGMSREFHTLKGTAATYGFESLSRLTREAEEKLASVTVPGHPEDLEGWARMAEFLSRMDRAKADIILLLKTIKGRDGEGGVTVPLGKIKLVKGLYSQVDAEARENSSDLSKLLQVCRSIDYIRLDKLVEKYSLMLQAVGERLGKRFQFQIHPEDLEV